MSGDYRAKIIVGLPVKELLDHEDCDTFTDAAEQGDLDYASRYYDASQKDWVIGYELASAPDYGFADFTYSEEEVHKMKVSFLALTGLEARVILCLHGS